MSLKTCIVLIFLFQWACGANREGGSDVETFELNDLEYLNVSGELKHTSKSVEGTGVIIFLEPLKSLKSGSHFAFKAVLSKGSSIHLIAFATNDGENGVEIGFTSDRELKVKLSARDSSEEISDHFSDENKDNLSFSSDIHNDESPAHVLIWKGDETEFSEDASLFNSENGPATPGSGHGTFWGFRLKDAKLTQASISDPKFEE